MKQLTNMRFVALTFLALGVLGAGGVFVSSLMSRPSTPDVSAQSVESAGPMQADTASSSVPDERYGYVEGPVSYPAGTVPSDIRVCAVNLATVRETCTTDIVRNKRFKGGRGYRLRLQPGNYQVYAVVPSFDPGYQAFYSAFVVCGYRSACTDHSPITVGVRSGKTRTDIEPGDFYE